MILFMCIYVMWTIPPKKIKKKNTPTPPPRSECPGQQLGIECPVRAQRMNKYRNTRNSIRESFQYEMPVGYIIQKLFRGFCFLDEMFNWHL